MLSAYRGSSFDMGPGFLAIAVVDSKLIQGLTVCVAATTPLGLLRAVTGTLRALIAKVRSFVRSFICSQKTKFSDSFAALAVALIRGRV